MRSRITNAEPPSTDARAPKPNSTSLPEPPSTDARAPKPNSTSLPEPPSGWQPGQFPHERLDAFHVAKEALLRGDKLALNLPRGYAKLADQLRRSLLAVYLGVAEAACRRGADRRNRFTCSQGETSEAAAALDAVRFLGLDSTGDAAQIRLLLARLAAMLTRLSQHAR